MRARKSRESYRRWDRDDTLQSALSFVIIDETLMRRIKILICDDSHVSTSVPKYYSSEQNMREFCDSFPWIDILSKSLRSSWLNWLMARANLRSRFVILSVILGVKVTRKGRFAISLRDKIRLNRLRYSSILRQ
jgi:hypothetical protein